LVFLFSSAHELDLAQVMETTRGFVFNGAVKHLACPTDTSVSLLSFAVRAPLTIPLQNLKVAATYQHLLAERLPNLPPKKWLTLSDDEYRVALLRSGGPRDAPKKTRDIWWRIIHCTQYLGRNIAKFDADRAPTCACGEPETTAHLFIECDRARFVLRSLRLPTDARTLLLGGNLNSSPCEHFSLRLAACWWAIWTSRNDLVHNGSLSTSDDLLQRARGFLLSWLNLALYRLRAKRFLRRYSHICGLDATKKAVRLY
jgi:hypothetical protein